MARLVVSAGDPSGDEHAARVLVALSSLHPGLQVRGMGGRNLRTAGMEIVVDIDKEGSVMGFQEVLFSATKILSAWRKMKALLKVWRPNLLIIVDYPDFNLRLARYAKSLGIKVLYYITPQLWAWRSGRVKSLIEYVDQAAVIFPFERKFLKERGYNQALFVGHPFADRLWRQEDPQFEEAFRRNFILTQDLNPEEPVIAIFPGSRVFEITRHLPFMRDAFSLFKQEHPNIQAIVAATHLTENTVREIVPPSIPGFRIVVDKSLDVLRVSDAGLLKSGTSNLQAAFYGLPFAMCYRTSKLSEFIVRYLVKVKEFSMVNVMRRGTVPELLQEETSPEKVAEVLKSLLIDKRKKVQMKEGLQEVTNQLSIYDPHELFEGCKTTNERVARLVHAQF